jgi:D-xylonolactonase
MKPEQIADRKCLLGEGPLWHPEEKKLYWTDIHGGKIFRYDPGTGEDEIFFEGPSVAGFTFQEDGGLLLFLEKGAVKLLRDGELTTLIEEIPEETSSRFNDVIADPAGRVFCGTMPCKRGPGRLYLLETDGTIRVLLEGIECSNGMGFTPDRKGLYYTDSLKREIYLFDYDEKNGALSNQRVFVQTPEDEGVPDGMTVDVEGYVWSARWDGNCLVRYAPDGTEDRRFEFPARKVTSVVFGGDDYTDMYVTTAGGDKRESQGRGAGALFRLNAGVKGNPEFFSRVRV